jgi:hypothetical protein
MVFKHAEQCSIRPASRARWTVPGSPGDDRGHVRAVLVDIRAGNIREGV